MLQQINHLIEVWIKVQFKPLMFFAHSIFMKKPSICCALCMVICLFWLLFCVSGWLYVIGNQNLWLDNIPSRFQFEICRFSGKYVNLNMPENRISDQINSLKVIEVRSISRWLWNPSSSINSEPTYYSCYAFFSLLFCLIASSCLSTTQKTWGVYFCVWHI